VCLQYLKVHVHCSITRLHIAQTTMSTEHVPYVLHIHLNPFIYANMTSVFVLLKIAANLTCPIFGAV